MIGRIRRYTQNAGTFATVYNLVVFALVVYILVRTSSTSAVNALVGVILIFPLAAFGLFAPRLVLPWLVRNAENALSFAQGIGYLVWIAVLLRFTVLSGFPPGVPFLMVLAVFLSFGISFWLLSDKRVRINAQSTVEVDGGIVRSIANQWRPDEATRGARGPAGGQIVHDFAYKDEARVTIEQVRHGTWTITSRVDGVLDHTRSLTSQKAAQREAESMMMPLGYIALRAQDIDDEHAREEVAEACEEFLVRFPPDHA